MKERPILFSGPMVRAILEGRKTMTRRVVKPQFGQLWGYGVKTGDDVFSAHVDIDDGTGKWRWIPCPYGRPGDRLWVRETWCQKIEEGRHIYNSEGNLDPSCCCYRADGEYISSVDDEGFQKYRKDGYEASPWSPSIHMPRWASRLTLEIVSVRVERLQEISEEDAKAEGFQSGEPMTFDEIHAMKHGSPERSLAVEFGVGSRSTAKLAFDMAWDSLNSKRGFSWSSNPWVWVIEFKRIV